MEKKGIVAHLDSVNEFEREPIPTSKLKGLKSFIGMYAGEHTAGTEFVIGPLQHENGIFEKYLSSSVASNILSIST